MVKTAAKVTNLTYAEFHCGVGDPFFNTVEFGGRRSGGAGLLLSASYDWDKIDILSGH
jgi:hypothetical protein